MCWWSWVSWSSGIGLCWRSWRTARRSLRRRAGTGWRGRQCMSGCAGMPMRGRPPWLTGPSGLRARQRRCRTRSGAPVRCRPGRPAGVSRWVSAHGKISLAGFSYHAGATYAGEPAEVVVAAGLADILHHGVVVATHAQRLRADQADRAPRAPVARRVRDATKGLTVTRLADGAGVVSFAGTPYAAGRRWARTAIDVSIVAASVQLSKDGKVIRVHPPRPLPRTRRLRQPPGPPPPQELRHRQRRLATGTHTSPGYRNLTSRTRLPSCR